MKTFKINNNFPVCLRVQTKSYKLSIKYKD